MKVGSDTSENFPEKILIYPIQYTIFNMKKPTIIYWAFLLKNGCNSPSNKHRILGPSGALVQIPEA
jgi:hypothetical protein